VLSGDVLAADLTGPRGPCFLVKQFQRLRDRDIAVYWAAGQVAHAARVPANGHASRVSHDPTGQVETPDAWPVHVELPDNVHRFTPDACEFTHRRGGMAVARLIGVAPPGSPQSNGSMSRSLAIASTGLPTIGVVHVEGEPSSAFFSSTQAVHYWALGGRHDSHTLLEDRPVAHFCGSPQGRSPEETGPHGCTLVAVDEPGAVRHRSMPTDLFRWRRETVTIDETTTADQLRQACRDRLGQIVAGENDVAHLVCWTVQGDGPLARRLRRDALAAELVEELRSDYGYRNPTAWTVSLDIQHSQPLPRECYEEQTFLGDYLRAVREGEQGPAATIDLAQYVTLDEPHLAGELVERLRGASAAERLRLLEQAAWLGIDLLRPQTPSC